MSHEMIELRPDQSLCNPDFDHYILSTHQGVIRKVPTKPAKQSTLKPDQWSYEHSLMFANAEKLIIDSFVRNEDHLYYFSNDFQIVKVVYQPSMAASTFSGPVIQLATPSPSAATFPPTLFFPTADLAVASNGAGLFSIYRTGDRAQSGPWQKILSFQVDDTTNVKETEDEFPNAVPCILADARAGDGGQLAVLIHRVVASNDAQPTEEGSTGRTQPPFVSRILWVNVDINSTSISRTREVVVKGNLELLTFNHDATELVTCGATEPKFEFDSMAAVKDDEKMDTSEAQNPFYIWTQDAEEITVTFPLKEKAEKADVQYKLSSGLVEVAIKGVKYLNGRLAGPVHLDSSTWTLSDDALAITFFKVRGHFWREVILGDKNCRYEPNPDEFKKALQSLEKYTLDREALPGNDVEPPFNREQLEDVDATPDQPNLLFWVNGETHCLTQCADASSSQLLFETRLQPGGPKTLCTRYDNDGIVWSLDSCDLAPGLKIAHKFSLSAFGYVQASHANKVGSGCSPSGSFAAVIHPDHHVFVYLQAVPVNNDCQLRNRRSGRVQSNVSEQLIYNTATVLDAEGTHNIIGFAVTDSAVYVLTNSEVIACHIKNE